MTSAPIEQAIDSVDQRAAAVASQLVGIHLLPPVQLSDEGVVDVEGTGAPQLMIADPAEHAWRPIALPAGSYWQLRAVPVRPELARLIGPDGRPLA